MTMCKRVGDLETSMIFWPWPGLAMASLWPARGQDGVVPFPQRQTGESVAVFAQINLIWPLSFFHKIDLIVRFRLAGVRIRGHEED
jgi:hypothetical protein